MLGLTDALSFMTSRTIAALSLHHARVRVDRLFPSTTFELRENRSVVTFIALHREGAFAVSVHPRNSDLRFNGLC